MAVLVQEHRAQIHLAGGLGTRSCDPFVQVRGGNELRVVVWRRVEEPVVAGGVGVEGDGIAEGWNLVRFTLGMGTRAARCAMKSRGSKKTWVVPSR